MAPKSSWFKMYWMMMAGLIKARAMIYKAEAGDDQQLVPIKAISTSGSPPESANAPMPPVANEAMHIKNKERQRVHKLGDKDIQAIHEQFAPIFPFRQGFPTPSFTLRVMAMAYPNRKKMGKKRNEKKGDDQGR
ncbi:MAG: hypothetical protein M5U34_43075 [Chloroflexi bacterium]|nr:hypothetical protein [Chloroflexota bacterium]